MAKHSGIRALKNFKNMNKKSGQVATRRIAVSRRGDAMASGSPIIESSVDVPAYLEETPVFAGGQFDFTDGGSRSGSAARTKQIISSLNMNQRHRGKKSGISAKLRVLLDTITGKRTKDSAALDFASNHKRVSKRTRRNRMIAYVGTGFAVVAILLALVFVPGGKAASTNGSPSGSGNGFGQEAMAAVVGEIGTKSSITAKSSEPPAPSPSASPSVSMAAAAATDESPEPSASPSPAEAPTETPAMTPPPNPTEASTPIPTTEPDPTPPPITAEGCVEFFVVEADAYYNEMGYSNNHYEYTADDVYMLAQIIQSEAGGETTEGMIAVGNVVMNRVLNRHKFGNTVAEVITAPGQFAYNPDRKPSSKAKRAARAVLQDENWVIPQDIYYFRSGVSAGGDWGSHRFYTKIGGHCFYRHSYSGRHRGGEAPPELFNRTFKYAQYGCKPEDRVYRIQYMLNKLGYDVKADKYFGKDSVDALKKFQEEHGLEADGIAGPSTVEKLIEEFGLSNYYLKFVAE